MIIEEWIMKKCTRYSTSLGRYWEVSELVNCDEKDIPASSILFKEEVREWCRLAYPDHPRGRRNYGKCDLCPPKAPYRADILDTFSHFKTIYAVFDFKRYKELVIEAHDQWTERQVENVLWWQSGVKNVLKQKVLSNYVRGARDIVADVILGAGSGFGNYQSMESAGIDVFTTMRKNGIQMERRPINNITIVSLIAWNDKDVKKIEQPSLFDFMKVPGERS